MPTLHEVVEALIARLDDDAPEVSKAASRALISIGDPSIPQLVGALAGAPSLHRGVILGVLSKLEMPEAQILGPIRLEIETAYRLVAERMTLDALEESPGRDYLLQALKVEVDDVVQSVFRLLRAVGLSREIDLVKRGLVSPDRRLMAVAIEGMEKIVHKDLSGILVPLVEKPPLREKFAVGSKAFGLKRPEVDELIGQYLDSGDKVRQIGAIALLEESGKADEWAEPLGRLLSEAAPVVRAQLKMEPSRVGGSSRMMTPLEKVLFLRKVDFFKDLDVRTLTAIASIAEEQPFEAQEVLCREGEAGDSMFCLVEGTVRVLKSRQDGSSMELAVVGPPEVLGEMALFEDKPRSATLQTADKTTVLVIDQMAFGEIMGEYPQVGVNASRILCRRLREAGLRDSLLRAGETSEERRSHLRMGAGLTATLEGSRQARLENLSMGGAYLVEERASSPGQRLSVTVELPDHGPLVLEGTVRRSELAPTGQGFGTAVAFESLDEASAQALKGWLEEHSGGDS